MRENTKQIFVGFSSHLILVPKVKNLNQSSAVPLYSTERNVYILVMIYHILKQISGRSESLEVCLSLLIVVRVQGIYSDQLNKFYLVKTRISLFVQIQRSHCVIHVPLALYCILITQSQILYRVVNLLFVLNLESHKNLSCLNKIS